MRRLTPQELMLIFAVLAIVVVGACVHYYRGVTVPPPPPELALPADSETGVLPSMNDIDEDD